VCLEPWQLKPKRHEKRALKLSQLKENKKRQGKYHTNELVRRLFFFFGREMTELLLLFFFLLYFSSMFRALKDAADVIMQSPTALQLRYLQTLTTIASEKNSTIVFPIPVMDMTSNLNVTSYLETHL
jgi:hypothetical protein